MNSLMTHYAKPAATLAITLLMAACGGSGGPGAGSKDLTGETGGIVGTINGVTYNYDGDLRYTAAGDKRSIHVENMSNGAESWAIYFIPPEVGTYHCGGGNNLKISLARDSAPSGSTGPCTVTVNIANDDKLEGTFSADLPDGRTFHTVENGFFRAVFADAILDYDHDGVSDADDNCVFTSNPDQADDDANELGNACEPDNGNGSGGGGQANRCNPQGNPATLPNCGPDDLNQLCAIPGIDLLIESLQPGTC